MRNLFFVCALICSFVFVAPRVVHAAADNVTVQTIQGPTLADKVVQRTKGSWSWYVARGTGIIAALALTILMLSGIGLVTGHTFKILEPLTAWASHRALGITFSIAVVLHMASFIFDKFVPFSILELLVPWLSNYKPTKLLGHNVGSLYVALGVLAFYGVAIVLITSLTIIDKKPYMWKFIHFLSYLVMLFVFVHALYLGTDLASGILRLIWVIGGFAVAIGVLARLRRARTTE